jgi:hypothetical protein
MEELGKILVSLITTKVILLIGIMICGMTEAGTSDLDHPHQSPLTSVPGCLLLALVVMIRVPSTGQPFFSGIS